MKKFYFGHGMSKICFDSTMKQIKKMTEIKLFHVIINKDCLETSRMLPCLQELMDAGLEMPEHQDYLTRYLQSGVATGFLTPQSRKKVQNLDFVEGIEQEGVETFMEEKSF